MPKVTILPQIEAKKNDALLQAVLAYKEIQTKLKFFENELKVHKSVIEEALQKTENGIISNELFTATLSIVERENFSLKAAKAEMGEEALKKFISKSVYTTLRVS